MTARKPTLRKQHHHSTCRECRSETYYDGPALGWLHVDSVIDRDHLPGKSGAQIWQPEIRR